MNKFQVFSAQTKVRDDINSRTREQLGIGMIEMAVVALLSLLGVAAALFLVPKWLESNKTNDEITDMSRIIPAIQAAASHENDYGSMSQARIQNENILPDTYLTSTAGTFRNRFDGVTTFVAATRSTSNDTMVAQETNLPQRACLDLTRSLNGMTTRILINGTSVKAFGGTLDNTAVATQCANTPTTVAYSFSK